MKVLIFGHKNCVDGCCAAILAKLAFDYVNYDRLEYLESTGTQYIDTGVYLTGKSRVIVDTKLDLVSSSSGNHIFGTEDYANSKWFSFYASDTKFGAYYYNVANVNLSDITFRFYSNIRIFIHIFDLCFVHCAVLRLFSSSDFVCFAQSFCFM